MKGTQSHKAGNSTYVKLDSNRLKHYKIWVSNLNWVSKQCILSEGLDSGLSCSLQKDMFTTNSQNI